MEPDETPATHARTEAPAQPHGTGLTRDDYLVIYGPLGIGWLILLGMMGVLWRDRNVQRRDFLASIATKDREHAAELERRDRECREERGENRAAMIVLTREQNETAKQLDERWREHARELRGTLDSATRKINRRE